MTGRHLVAAALLALLALLPACSLTMQPERAPAPPDGPGDCPTMCTHLHALGDCGIPAAECLGECEGASTAESEIGRHFPVGCLTAAATCEEARRCE